MKTKKSCLLVLISVFAFAGFTKAQDCKLFFPSKEGSVVELTQYDKKGSPTTYSTQKVIERTETAKGLTIRYQQILKDAKDDKTFTTEMGVKCENGKFYVDMNELFKGMNLESYQSAPEMQVTVDGDALFYPSDLHAGSTMPDGKVTAKVNTGGFTMLTMYVYLTNRKCEGIETITTPAGTFECYKITQDVEAKAIMKVLSTDISWLAEGVGLVKSESYDKKGKLIGSSQLTKFEN